MKMRTVLLSAAVLAIASVGRAQSDPKPFPPDFDILTKKSIFSRERMTQRSNGGGRNGRIRQAQAPRVYTPIFIGALLQDDGSFVAFIADPATGQLATFRVGDALPMSAGSIKEISLDDLTVTAADHSTKKIAMGQNILGGSAEYPAATPAEGAAPATAPDGTVETAPDSSGGDAAPAATPASPGETPAAMPDAAAEPSTPPAAAPTPAPAAGGPAGRLPGETMLDYFRRRRAQQLGK